MDLAGILFAGQGGTVVIDRGKKSCDGELFRGVSGAFAAADTADFADFALFGGFFRGVAVNVDIGIRIDKSDHAPGAGFSTFAAAHTQFSVDKGKTVDDLNRSEGAGIDTAAQPQTAETASFGVPS